MFGRLTQNCSKCDSVDVRRSRWLSHDEKVRNPGKEPVRCNDCGHRFLVDVRPNPKLLLIAGGSVIGLVVLVALTLMLAAGDLSGSEDETADAPAAEANLGPVTSADMQAAEAGDPDAQFRVASALLADPELNFAYSGKAIAFLESAAEKGHARARLRVGQLYRRGVGALQNYARAAKWLELSAKSGDAQGMMEYGRLFREGLGVDRDPIRAYIWFNRAAAARHPDAPLERQAVARLLTLEELQRAQEASLKPEAAEPMPPLVAGNAAK